MIKIQEKTPHHNYGGAYDIEPDQYFTKEDLLELAYDVCDRLEEMFYVTYPPDIVDVFIDGNDINMTISIGDIEVSTSRTIDMRRIHKRSDLVDKYTGEFVGYLRREIENTPEFFGRKS